MSISILEQQYNNNQDTSKQNTSNQSSTFSSNLSEIQKLRNQYRDNSGTNNQIVQNKKLNSENQGLILSEIKSSLKEANVTLTDIKNLLNDYLKSNISSSNPSSAPVDKNSNTKLQESNLKSISDAGSYRGKALSHAKLLITPARILNKANTYQEKVLGSLFNIQDLIRMATSEIMTIRMKGYGIRDNYLANSKIEKSKLSVDNDSLKEFRSVFERGEKDKRASGEQAKKLDFWDFLLNPFAIGGAAKFGLHKALVKLGIRDARSGEELTKKHGFNLSPQERAYNYLSDAFPAHMEEQNQILSDILAHTERLTKLSQFDIGQRYGVNIDQPVTSSREKRVFDPQTGQMIKEDELDKRNKKRREMLKVSVKQERGWLLNALTSLGVGTSNDQITNEAMENVQNAALSSAKSKEEDVNLRLKQENRINRAKNPVAKALNLAGLAAAGPMGFLLSSAVGNQLFKQEVSGVSPNDLKNIGEDDQIKLFDDQDQKENFQRVLEDAANPQLEVLQDIRELLKDQSNKFINEDGNTKELTQSMMGLPPRTIIKRFGIENASSIFLAMLGDKLDTINETLNKIGITLIDNLTEKTPNIQTLPGALSGGIVEESKGIVPFDGVTKLPTSGKTDNVPIVASQGEAILPANVVSKIGNENILSLVNNVDSLKVLSGEELSKIVSYKFGEAVGYSIQSLFQNHDPDFLSKVSGLFKKSPIQEINERIGRELEIAYRDMDFEKLKDIIQVVFNDYFGPENFKDVLIDGFNNIFKNIFGVEKSNIQEVRNDLNIFGYNIPFLKKRKSVVEEIHANIIKSLYGYLDQDTYDNIAANISNAFEENLLDKSIYKEGVHSFITGFISSLFPGEGAGNLKYNQFSGVTLDLLNDDKYTTLQKGWNLFKNRKLTVSDVIQKQLVSTILEEVDIDKLGSNLSEIINNELDNDRLKKIATDQISKIYLSLFNTDNIDEFAKVKIDRELSSLIDVKIPGLKEKVYLSQAITHDVVGSIYNNFKNNRHLLVNNINNYLNEGFQEIISREKVYTFFQSIIDSLFKLESQVKTQSFYQKILKILLNNTFHKKSSVVKSFVNYVDIGLQKFLNDNKEQVDFRIKEFFQKSINQLFNYRHIKFEDDSQHKELLNLLFKKLLGPNSKSIKLLIRSTKENSIKALTELSPHFKTRNKTFFKKIIDTLFDPDKIPKAKWMIRKRYKEFMKNTLEELLDTNSKISKLFRNNIKNTFKKIIKGKEFTGEVDERNRKVKYKYDIAPNIFKTFTAIKDKLLDYRIINRIKIPDKIYKDILKRTAYDIFYESKVLPLFLKEITSKFKRILKGKEKFEINNVTGKHKIDLPKSLYYFFTAVKNKILDDKKIYRVKIKDRIYREVLRKTAYDIFYESKVLPLFLNEITSKFKRILKGKEKFEINNVTGKHKIDLPTNLYYFFTAIKNKILDDKKIYRVRIKDKIYKNLMTKLLYDIFSSKVSETPELFIKEVSKRFRRVLKRKENILYNNKYQKIGIDFSTSLFHFFSAVKNKIFDEQIIKRTKLKKSVYQRLMNKLLITIFDDDEAGINRLFVGHTTKEFKKIIKKKADKRLDLKDDLLLFFNALKYKIFTIFDKDVYKKISKKQRKFILNISDDIFKDKDSKTKELFVKHVNKSFRRIIKNKEAEKLAINNELVSFFDVIKGHLFVIKNHDVQKQLNKAHYKLLLGYSKRLFNYRSTISNLFIKHINRNFRSIVKDNKDVLNIRELLIDFFQTINQIIFNKDLIKFDGNVLTDRYADYIESASYKLFAADTELRDSFLSYINKQASNVFNKNHIIVRDDLIDVFNYISKLILDSELVSYDKKLLIDKYNNFVEYSTDQLFIEDKTLHKLFVSYINKQSEKIFKDKSISIEEDLIEFFELIKSIVFNNKIEFNNFGLITESYNKFIENITDDLFKKNSGLNNLFISIIEDRSRALFDDESISVRNELLALFEKVKEITLQTEIVFNDYDFIRSKQNDFIKESAVQLFTNNPELVSLFGEYTANYFKEVINNQETDQELKENIVLFLNKVQSIIFTDKIDFQNYQLLEDVQNKYIVNAINDIFSTKSKIHKSFIDYIVKTFQRDVLERRKVKIHDKLESFYSYIGQSIFDVNKIHNFANKQDDKYGKFTNFLFDKLISKRSKPSNLLLNHINSTFKELSKDDGYGFMDTILQFVRKIKDDIFRVDDDHSARINKKKVKKRYQQLSDQIFKQVFGRKSPFFKAFDIDFDSATDELNILIKSKLFASDEIRDLYNKDNPLPVYVTNQVQKIESKGQQYIPHYAQGGELVSSGNSFNLAMLGDGGGPELLAYPASMSGHVTNNKDVIQLFESISDPLKDIKDFLKETRDLMRNKAIIGGFLSAIFGPLGPLIGEAAGSAISDMLSGLIATIPHVIQNTKLYKILTGDIKLFGKKNKDKKLPDEVTNTLDVQSRASGGSISPGLVQFHNGEFVELVNDNKGQVTDPKASQGIIDKLSEKLNPLTEFIKYQKQKDDVLTEDRLAKVRKREEENQFNNKLFEHLNKFESGIYKVSDNLSDVKSQLNKNKKGSLFDKLFNFFKLALPIIGGGLVGFNIFKAVKTGDLSELGAASTFTAKLVGRLGGGLIEGLLKFVGSSSSQIFGSIFKSITGGATAIAKSLNFGNIIQLFKDSAAKLLSKVGLGFLFSSGAMKAGGSIVKNIATSIPGLGMIVGTGFAVKRLLEGDFLGAALEFISGLPGIGLVKTLGLTGVLAIKDLFFSNKEDTGEGEVPEEAEQNAQGFFGKIFGWLKNQAGRIGNAIKNAFLNFTPLGWIIKPFLEGDKPEDVKEGEQENKQNSRGFFGKISDWIKERAGKVGGFIKNTFLNFTPLGWIIRPFLEGEDSEAELDKKIDDSGKGFSISDIIKKARDYLHDKVFGWFDNIFSSEKKEIQKELKETGSADLSENIQLKDSDKDSKEARLNIGSKSGLDKLMDKGERKDLAKLSGVGKRGKLTFTDKSGNEIDPKTSNIGLNVIEDNIKKIKSDSKLKGGSFNNIVSDIVELPDKTKLIKHSILNKNNDLMGEVFEHKGVSTLSVNEAAAVIEQANNREDKGYEIVKENGVYKVLKEYGGRTSGFFGRGIPDEYKEPKTVYKFTVPEEQKREKGGPVEAGQSYLVGEKGPEMFWPEESGKIIPLSKIKELIDGVKNQVKHTFEENSFSTSGLNQSLQQLFKFGVPSGADNKKTNQSNNKFTELGKKHIISNEGLSPTKYIDSEGYPTIGVGHKIEPNENIPSILSGPKILNLFNEDYQEHKKAAKKIPGYDSIHAAGKRALEDITFNMGPNWYKKFPKMINALKNKNYSLAAKELLNSKYARQVGIRARRNALLIQTGDPKYFNSQIAVHNAQSDEQKKQVLSQINDNLTPQDQEQIDQNLNQTNKKSKQYAKNLNANLNTPSYKSLSQNNLDTSTSDITNQSTTSSPASSNSNQSTVNTQPVANKPTNLLSQTQNIESDGDNPTYTKIDPYFDELVNAMFDITHSQFCDRFKRHGLGVFGLTRQEIY